MPVDTLHEWFSTAMACTPRRDGDTLHLTCRCGNVVIDAGSYHDASAQRVAPTIEPTQHATHGFHELNGETFLNRFANQYRQHLNRDHTVPLTAAAFQNVLDAPVGHIEFGNAEPPRTSVRVERPAEDLTVDASNLVVTQQPQTACLIEMLPPRVDYNDDVVRIRNTEIPLGGDVLTLRDVLQEWPNIDTDANRDGLQFHRSGHERVIVFTEHSEQLTLTRAQRPLLLDALNKVIEDNVGVMLGPAL